MNTDKEEKLQEGGREAFLLKEETHAIIGCAFEVLNELGHGLNEKCYENSIVVEFALRKIPFSQQRQFEVLEISVSICVHLCISVVKIFLCRNERASTIVKR